METLERIHALTKRDNERLSDLRNFVNTIPQKHDILYMRNKGKNNTERGSTMKLITAVFKKAFYLASASMVVYAIVKAFIMAYGFANSL